MTRRAARIDANHREIVAALEACGYLVYSTAALGRGFPDLVIQKHGITELVEVKTPKGDLTPEQHRFVDRGWNVWVVRGLEDVLAGVK